MTTANIYRLQCNNNNKTKINNKQIEAKQTKQKPKKSVIHSFKIMAKYRTDVYPYTALLLVLTLIHTKRLGRPAL